MLQPIAPPPMMTIRAWEGSTRVSDQVLGPSPTPLILRCEPKASLEGRNALRFERSEPRSTHERFPPPSRSDGGGGPTNHDGAFPPPAARGGGRGTAEGGGGASPRTALGTAPPPCFAWSP